MSEDTGAVLGRAEAQLEARLSEAGAGDQPAFAAFYDAVASSVFALLRCLIDDPRAAGDVALATFVEAWRTAPSFDAGQGTARMWIVSLALRQAAHAARVADGSDEPRLSPRGACIEIAHLADPERQILGLAYYSRFDQSQIGACMGLPLATIRTHMRLGLSQLHPPATPRTATA